MGVAESYPLFLCHKKIARQTIIESSLDSIQPAEGKSQSFCAFGVLLHPTMTTPAQSLEESDIGEQRSYATFGMMQIF
jgi:hypothetical protein